MALKRLGRYQLTKLLWHGRNAEVHLAQDSKSKMLVVIKLLHESFSDQQTDQQMRQKFLREAENLRLLDHPNIVRLIETNFDQGIRPYFVMAYAPGGTLRQKYSQDIPLSLETICSYLEQLAGALSYAHNHGIIHCDVKPTNVLLDKDGRLLLSDFGIARLSESTLPQATRDPFGTPIYMAPEQFKGKWDARTDQYALAVMVYEWFCGHPPFSGENRNQIMDYHLTMPVPSLQEAHARYKDTISDNILRKVEQILLKALAKEPSARFTSIEEFTRVLEQVLQPPIPVIPDASSIISSGEVSAFAEMSSISQRDSADLEQSLQEDVSVNAAQNIQVMSSQPIAIPSAQLSTSVNRGIQTSYAYRNTGQYLGSIVGIIGVLLIVLGVFTCPIASINTIQAAQAFYNTARITQGTVQKDTYEDASCGEGGACSISCTTIVTFTPSGKKNPFTIYDGLCDVLKKGEKVEVRYDPRNPEAAKTSRQASSDIPSYIILTIIWPIAAFICLGWVVFKIQDG